MKVTNTIITAVLTAKTFWEIKSPELRSFGSEVARSKVSLALGATAITYKYYMRVRDAERRLE